MTSQTPVRGEATKSDAAAARDASAGLAETYAKWFEVVPARTPQQLEDAYRIRYQVYCVENAYEDPAANPTGLETDEYDSRAPHVLLLHRPSRAVAGTVRLVLPCHSSPNESFVIQKLCDHPLLKDAARFPLASAGEISRFCISRDFRRRCGDGQYPRNEPPGGGEDRRRLIPNMCLGLMQGVFRMSIDHGVTHLCAEMEPALLRLLGGLGIRFEPLGPLVDFHGRRQPCYAEISRMFYDLQKERPEIWGVLTDQGRLRPGTSPPADPSE